MKKIIIIGANGHTAKQIILRLLEQEDVSLTLFLRHSQRLAHLKSGRVTLFDGDANNLNDLKQAISGHDIVISTMGGMDLDIKTENVVKAMEAVGVSRIIAISAGGIYDELPEPFNTWDKRMVGETRPINLKTVQVIEQSTLSYTILRPVWLTDKSVETFELTQKGEQYKGTETSRASIGRFVASVVQDPTLYMDQNLGISQPNTEGDRPAAYR